MDPELTAEVAPSSSAPHLALYRRWRAQTFSRIVGQEAVVTTLRNAVRTGQVAHALLFVGPRGTGKTSMARIVAKALNCTNLQDGDPCDACPSCVAIRDGRTLDVVELDAATNNKVDQIRELVERTWTAPSDLRRKVFIIDEVQRITDGWDVLLKTLEEPPDHIVFILCTTDPTRIRPAVLSRVQRYEFRRLTIAQIEGKLTTILAADGREADPAAIDLVARQAAGGMRDAESMLDQLLSSSDGRLSVEAVRDLLGLVDGEVIDAFVDALVRVDPLAGIAILDEVESSGRDLGAFLDQVVVALRTALSRALVGKTEMRPGSDGCRADRGCAADRRDRSEPAGRRRRPVPAGAGPDQRRAGESGSRHGIAASTEAAPIAAASKPARRAEARPESPPSEPTPAPVAEPAEATPAAVRHHRCRYRRAIARPSRLQGPARGLDRGHDRGSHHGGVAGRANGRDSIADAPPAEPPTEAPAAEASPAEPAGPPRPPPRRRGASRPLAQRTSRRGSWARRRRRRAERSGRHPCRRAP